MLLSLHLPTSLAMELVTEMLKRLLLVHSAAKFINILQLNIRLVLAVEHVRHRPRLKLVTLLVLPASILFTVPGRHAVKLTRGSVSFSLSSSNAFCFGFTTAFFSQEALAIAVQGVDRPAVLFTRSHKPALLEHG
ncbi:hypothetical protein H113_01487 [Trichophyton rubrum MR1459]|nr:hypothetical protein H113_01487 [Trichophyton rubrum MR1459]EZG09796.1 hypothetical protein H106_01248 [Trichophyton rubrum CBS 735.88]